MSGQHLLVVVTGLLSVLLLHLTVTRADSGCSVSTINLENYVPSDSTPQIGDNVTYSFTCTVTLSCNMTSNTSMDGLTINITNGLDNVVLSDSSTVTNTTFDDTFSVTATVGSPVKLSDAGLYTCTVAINEVVSDMNSTSSFNVIIPNNTHTVFVNNNQVGVTQGGNLTDLMCTVTLQQNIVNSLMGSFIRISWSPNTIPDLNTRVVSPSTSISELFTITSVSIAYAGEYKCSAEIFYNDTNSDYVTIPQQPIPEDAINIQVKALTPSVSVLNEFVRIGDPATLTCTIDITDDNPLLVDASVTWDPSNGVQTVARSSSSDTTFLSEYMIGNVQPGNATNYTCSATINPVDNSNILSSNSSSDVGTLYATEISFDTNATVVLDVSPYNVFSSMCNVAYYPDNAPITIDLVSNSTSAQTMVSPSSFSGTLPPSPVVDSRIVTAVISDSTTLIQYMCQVNITIDDITLTSISSDPVYVVIQGPVEPLRAVSVQSQTTNVSATVTWTIPRVTYTPETYTVEYGLSCDNLNNSITNMTRNIDNLQFLTDTNEEYSVTIIGLDIGKAYCYRINSSNTFDSVVTENLMFTTSEEAPSKPENFRNTSVGTNNITVTWGEPIMKNGVILFYNYTCVDEMTNIMFTGGVEGTTTVAVVQGLSPFTMYQCEVSASTSVGMSEPSDVLIVTTLQDAPSGPPTEFMITSSNDNPTQLVLSWKAPAPEDQNGIITEYRYKCSNNPDQVNMTSGDITTVTVKGLAVFTNYTCDVRAATVVGVGPAVSQDAITGEDAPEAVTDLAFQAINETSFYVSWKPPNVLNGNLLHYTITVSNYANDAVVVDDRRTNSAEDTVTSNMFRTGVPYYVNVSAVTGGGVGPHDSIVNFTQQGTPAKVTGVEFSRINDTAIRVSWNRLTYEQAQGFIMYKVVVTTTSEDSRKRQTSDPIEVFVEFSKASVDISGVLSSSSYSITVTAVNTYDENKTGEASVAISVPGPATNATGVIVGVLCGCLVLILVIVVIVMIIIIIRKRMDQTKDPEVHQNLAILDNSKREEEDGNELKLLSVTRNPEFSERIQAVAVPDFAEHVHQLHMNRDLGFEEEYESLKSIPIGSFTVAKMECNIPKNRFDNVYSYDDSRVVLPIPEGGNSDYINASFIDGYNRPKAYIAAQGPLVNTIVDFWHMIWEFQLPTIVMLTELIERGIEKCSLYFPRSTNETLDVGRGLQVTCTEQQQFVEYRFKKFLLVNTNKGGGRLDVVHYHFLAWPDHGVPADKTVMMAFARRVRQTHPPEGPPLIVHCSAGVGRTGTFIVLDTMMQRLEKNEGSLNIYELVADMRSKRTLMVQTMAQYIYTHDALSEYIICGDTSITTKKLRDRMNELGKVSGGESGYKKQLDLLNQISLAPSEGLCSDSLSKQNVVKNRYSQVVTSLPYNDTRVKLRTTSGVGDYINASVVDGYKHKGAFLATQTPLESTTGDLWRMVWEKWSASIVMLCSLEEVETYHCYWPEKVDEKQVYGMIEVRLVSEKEEKGFTVRKFELSQESNYINLATGNADKLLVTQYQYNQWPVDGKPSKCDSLLKLLDQLLKTQTLSGNKAITVMCNNGIDRTGAFICLYSQLERVKVEGIADIFQFVKASRFHRPGLIQSVDNYVFCHELLQEFLNSFDQYENFK